MAHRHLKRGAGGARVIGRRRGAAACLLALAACGERVSEPARAPQAAAAARAADFAPDEGSWGRFRSKRFQLELPLPDGRAWKIDDHSRPALVAVHETTASRLHLRATHEDELMNRAKCEARARELGWVPTAQLATIEDEVTVGPEAYDSRVWVAVDASQPGGAVTGHVFLFGAFIRRCLLVHVETTVPSREHEGVLSSRLATVGARVVRGITLDAPRTTDDAAVPKHKPDIRR